MISLVVDNQTRKADLERDGGNIITSDLLYTTVTIALFTRRRALPTDVLPDPLSRERGGWWADAHAEDEEQLGSRLWLLNRSKDTQTVLNQAKIYAEEALQFLVDDGVAKSVTVTTESHPNEVLAFKVEILRTDQFSSKWDAVWTAHVGEL
jgi:phage gp46-like protein